MATATKRKAAVDWSDRDSAMAEIQRLRDDEGMQWAAIVEESGIGQGRCMLLYMYASVEDSDRITAKNDAELGKKIVAARGAGLSWGQIMARAQISENKARKLYEETTGESTIGNRIGKGGRYAAGAERPEPAPKVAKANGAAKATGTTKKAAAAAPAASSGTGTKNVNDMTLEELQARIDGKSIVVKKGTGQETIKVKVVKGLKDGAISLSTEDGKQRVISLENIKKVSRR